MKVRLRVYVLGLPRVVAKKIQPEMGVKQVEVLLYVAVSLLIRMNESLSIRKTG